MKICPKCQQTYTDENLNFCLNDGSTLTQKSEGGDALPETIFVSQPPPTTPNQPFPTAPNQPFGGGQQQQQQFGGAPQNAWNAPQSPYPQTSSPQRKSKSWVWVLGILGVLVLLCGGGGILGFIALRNANDSSNYNFSYPTPTASPTVSSNITKYDMTLWKPYAGDAATTSYSDGKFTIEVTKDNYYYVVITQPNATTKAEHETQNATTKVTVVNRLAQSSKNGFGLVVHSDTTPLTQDYAFVIDSENKKYRILHHSLKQEKILTNWTSFSGIKSGTAENVIEVRDTGKVMQFYINGQFVKSVNDEDDNTDGIAGIYSSEKMPIDFTNLQIEKK
jgi:hypothetical protein